MILAAVFFVFGAWCVQYLAQLPSVNGLIVAGVIASLVLWVCLLLKHVRLFADANLLAIKGLRFVLFAASAFLVGLIWTSTYAHIRLSQVLPAALEQKSIQLVGVVASVPEVTERGVRFNFIVENVVTPKLQDPQSFPKQISLNYYPQSFLPLSVLNQSNATNNVAKSIFHAGERWRLTAKLKRPHSTQNPHGYDFEAWALSENIRATGSIKNKAKMQRLQSMVWQPKYMVARLRENIKAHVVTALKEEPYSGIILALVMGDDSQIKRVDWDVMLKTGTTHLMSISGLHITMLAGFMFGLTNMAWRRFPRGMLYMPARKVATIAGVLTALLYALVAGFSVPTQRTLYMLCIFAIALWSGRKVAISQVLAIALLVVVLFDPWAVSSVGFWLSFGAVAMLAYVFSAKVGNIHWLTAAIHTQWVVTLGMLPLLLVMFNQTSIVSPIANAVAIPLISFLVTPLALIGSFLSLDFLLQFSHAILSGGMALLGWLSTLPIAVWQQHAPSAWMLIPALFGVMWLLLPRGFPLLWLGLFGFLPMLLISPPRPLMGEMQATVLDVGQGLSVVVQTKNHVLLYDTGNQYNAQNDAGKSVIVPFLRGEGLAKIDGMVLSHDDSDHTGGSASILAAMPVKWLSSSFALDAHLESSTPEVITSLPTLYRCQAGQMWRWDNVLFEVLYPTTDAYHVVDLSDNNKSCVIKVTSQYGSLLLTGDIEKTAELALLSNAALSKKLKSDVLTVPHHGSKTSSTINFIGAVAPTAAVFTVGYLNRYRHPKAAVLSRYNAQIPYVMRSDYDGAATFYFTQNPSQLNNMNTTGAIRISRVRAQNKRYWHQSFEATH